MAHGSADAEARMLTNLAAQLQALTSQPSDINAVSIRLPDFWIKSPEVWFAKVESQFGTKNITQDQTKYDYVVGALDINTADEVQSILINPPVSNKYDTLKTALIKTFGKSQAQKDAELLNLDGLGDKRPTALMRKINALNDDPQTLKRALFRSNLPTDIRSILAGHNITNIDELAETADRIWERVLQVSSKCRFQLTHTAEPAADLWKLSLLRLNQDHISIGLHGHHHTATHSQLRMQHSPQFKFVSTIKDLDQMLAVANRVANLHHS